jgi:hypothetical protein
MKRIDQVDNAGVVLKIKNHDALAAVVQGRANRNDIDTLIGALNMTEAFCLLNIGQDWRPEVGQAQDALYELAKRGVKLGRFILTGPEMQALNLAMDIHDAQLEAATVRQLEQALEIVEKTIRHGKARRIQVAA